MRKIEITWTTASGVGPPYFGVATVYTSTSGIPLTEIGSINIQKGDTVVDDGLFITSPGAGQAYQPDTILETDRIEMQSMADEYYDGTNTSGVTWRII